MEDILIYQALKDAEIVKREQEEAGDQAGVVGSYLEVDSLILSMSAHFVFLWVFVWLLAGIFRTPYGFVRRRSSGRWFC